MSVFASDLAGDEHLSRPDLAAGGDSDFLVERPNERTGANLIEEEDAGSERTFSDAGAERTEDGDQEMAGFDLRRAGQVDAGQAEAAAGPEVRRASAPGVFSRAWAGIKRGASSLGRGLGSALRDFGFGRLFGSRRAAPDPSDPGAVAEASARRDYQASGGRTIDDTRFRQAVGPQLPWMARLFGAGPGGRGSANAEASKARSDASLASRGPAPRVTFLKPTPNKVGYGEGRNKERRPVGFTPNSSWAVPAHGQAPSEMLGANRGVSMSGSTPSEALTGLEEARQFAMDYGEYTPPGMIRGNDYPELRASAQERRLKARRLAGGLGRVDQQAGADYRMNRTLQKSAAALGAENFIPEAPIQDEFEVEDEDADM